MTHHYFVRITHPWVVARRVVDQWETHCDKVLVYEHVGEETGKDHVHIVLEHCEHQKKWLRKLGERVGVNLKGNEMCSFKEYDGNATAMRYMTKGKYDPVFNKGYSAEDIALWKSQWVLPSRRTKAYYLYESAFGDDEYNESHFDDWKQSYPQDPKRPLLDGELRFKWCRFVAWSHALRVNDELVTLKTINDYKMLVYTYAARHGNVLIPDKDPVFKQLV